MTETKNKPEPKPKFKKGDEVMIVYDLAMYMKSYYDMRKGDNGDYVVAEDLDDNWLFHVDNFIKYMKITVGKITAN